MTKARSILTLALVFALTGAAHAIDRGAAMIDTFSLDVAELDDADRVGVSVLAENTLDSPRQDWAMLLGLGFEEISPDNSRNIDNWAFSIGLKYYLTKVTSFSALGTYQWFDGDIQKDAKMGSVGVKQRFLPVENYVSPFGTASLAWRERSTFSDTGVTDDEFSEVLFTFGGGVEFRMNDSLSFVFEAAYTEADNSEDNSEDLDGFSGSVAMTYYFMPDDD